MPEDNVKYITPPNNLRQKQKLAGVTGTLDASWVEAAERQIVAAKFDYEEAVGEDLAKLHSAYEKALSDPENRVEHIQKLYAIVQTVKGQGSSFGYPLISAIGAQLARFIEDQGDELTDAQMEVVKVHVEAIRLVMQQKMEGEGGAVGKQIVSGLGLVIKKVAQEALFQSPLNFVQYQVAVPVGVLPAPRWATPPTGLGRRPLNKACLKA